MEDRAKYSQAEKKYSLSDKLSFVLFRLFIVSFPFYLFESGGAQISSVFGALLIALSVGRIYQAVWSSQTAPFFVFVFVTYIVNISNEIAIGSFFELTEHSIFYTYNVMIMASVASLLWQYKEKSADTIRTWIYMSIAVQIMLVPLFIDKTSRNELFFNNPNQLGYWALLMSSIVGYISSINGRKVSVIEGGAHAACLVLILLSQSKAAIAAMVILLLIRFGISLKSILIGTSMATVIFMTVDMSQVLDVTSQRFDRIGIDPDDDIWNRGYNRIFDYPQYMIFGFGEGAYWRIGQHLEAHSVIVTLLFSYGIIGFASFSYAIMKIMRNDWPRAAMYIIPAFIYGLTHQGLRFTVLWVLLAVLTFGASKSLTRGK